MASSSDWDPNVIFAPSDHEFRIYGSDDLSIYAVVDEIDYSWATHWIWSPKFSKRGKKFYLRRNVQELHQPEFFNPNEGKIERVRTQRTLFLHTAIMLRTGIEPPTPEHKIVDHRDGKEMNCRRSNLRWATASMNAKNINGSHAQELGDW